MGENISSASSGHWGDFAYFEVMYTWALQWIDPVRLIQEGGAQLLDFVAVITVMNLAITRDLRWGLSGSIQISYTYVWLS